MTVPPRSHAFENRTGVRRRLLAAFGSLLLAGTAGAQVTSLYYQEIAKDGRIYVFNTAARYRTFQASGEMGAAITLAGRGPAGETVVAENETALDLFLFRHGLPAYERPAPAPAFPQVKVGGTAFLSYQDGQSGGADYAKFVIKRAYINLGATLSPWLSARITPDVTLDTATGETKYRLKFAYGLFSVGSFGPITGVAVQAGMVPTPWLEFEDKVDQYRMQDAMFLDRLGIISSADVGVMVAGTFGGEAPAKLCKDLPAASPGRYGSFALGIYNGGGYTASEKNTNKPIQGRLTIRPLPGVVPGFQVSGFGVTGKGNTAANPDWTLSAGAVSFESRWATVMATYVRGKGNLSGTAVDAAGKSLAYEAWSGFVEAKVARTWSVIGRYDLATPDTRVTNVKTARTIAGVAYHLGQGNDILLDRDVVRYEGTSKPDDARTQLTLQIKF
jgi:hypothetical protein